jgi:hypothetical protein
MLMSSRACRGRGFSILGLMGILALLLLARPTSAIAQAEECGGWMVSCASVQVHADGDRLFFYVPNATPPAELPADGMDAAGERLRVYANIEGMTCDPATGRGCVDITESWLDAAEPVRGSPTAGEAPATVVDPGNGSCEDEAEWMDPARGMSEEEGRRCSRPVAAFFILALPASAFLFAADGDEPEVVLPIGSDPELPGGGADDGSSSSDGSGSGGDGSSGGTGSGGSDGGSSSSGGGGSDGGDNGGGDTGGGNTGGDTSGGLPVGPGGGGDPDMGEVPEPISTTLFGIGLLGYAGARLRQRRSGGEGEDA